MNDFGEYCKELIIESNITTEETSPGLAKITRSSLPSSSSRGGRGQRGRGGRIRRGNDWRKPKEDNKVDDKGEAKDEPEEKQLRGAPPKGADIDEWAKRQRCQQPQYINGTECTHCRLDGHPTKAYFHLMEEFVFNGWEPFPEVQCYATARMEKKDAKDRKK